MCHSVRGAVYSPLRIGEGEHRLLAQILVHGAQQAHAYVVAFGCGFEPVELVHQHVKHFFGAVAAFAPVL